MHSGHVPLEFGQSYTIPLGYSKVIVVILKDLVPTVHDYGGISISPVLSKVFEHCILRRFRSFLTTSDNQFGFKKSLGCTQAIYCVRSVVS